MLPPGGTEQSPEVLDDAEIMRRIEQDGDDDSNDDSLNEQL